MYKNVYIIYKCIQTKELCIYECTQYNVKSWKHTSNNKIRVHSKLQKINEGNIKLLLKPKTELLKFNTICL